ncbi:YkvI family membrane protein [Jeotgalicoccus marinus]|uniref:YkvI family membrane protein n=1 Tax=Jeotgalicoccus marinus TaxID=516700 RepID=UPI00040FDCDC|nr:membrane protein [Jeotgalicoccus marinus]
MSNGLRRASWKYAFAYTGIVVGAGFATGQEVLQFFSSYGLISIIGVILTGLIVMFIGRQAAKLGYSTNAESHVLPLNTLFGVKLGKVVDIILAFFLYGLAVVMIAGSGATFNEGFGLNPQVGAIFLIIVAFVTLLMDFDKIISIIGSITPVLVIALFIIAIYNIFNPMVPFSEVNQYNDTSHTPTRSWWFDAITYSGFTLATAFSFLSIMGSESARQSIVRRGAIYGGLLITFIMLLINFGILSIMPAAYDVSLPTMQMANNLSPWIGTAYSIIIILLIFNSVVGFLYPFLSRFTKPQSGKYKILLISSLVIGYLATYVGFVELVNIIYPLFGYVGLTIGIMLTVRWIFLKRKAYHLAEKISDED